MFQICLQFFSFSLCMYRETILIVANPCWVISLQRKYSIHCEWFIINWSENFFLKNMAVCNLYDVVVVYPKLAQKLLTDFVKIRMKHVFWARIYTISYSEYIFKSAMFCLKSLFSKVLLLICQKYVCRRVGPFWRNNLKIGI